MKQERKKWETQTVLSKHKKIILLSRRFYSFGVEKKKLAAAFIVVVVVPKIHSILSKSRDNQKKSEKNQLFVCVSDPHTETHKQTFIFTSPKTASTSRHQFIFCSGSGSLWRPGKMSTTYPYRIHRLQLQGIYQITRGWLTGCFISSLLDLA